jgi:hypothetical protein
LLLLEQPTDLRTTVLVANAQHVCAARTAPRDHSAALRAPHEARRGFAARAGVLSELMDQVQLHSRTINRVADPGQRAISTSARR